MLQIMALEDWGYGTTWMHDRAVKISEIEPKNPFFQYVAHRGSNKEPMLPLILSQCPSPENDTYFKRHQWAWERETAEEAWRESMLWDCLFIASLYKEGGGPPSNSLDNNLAEALRQLSAAIELANSSKSNVDTQLAALEALVNNLDDPAALLQAYSALVVSAGGEAVESVSIAGEVVLSEAARAAEEAAKAAEEAARAAEETARRAAEEAARAAEEAARAAEEAAKKTPVGQVICGVVGC
jgi:hypothetical protein